ncbi:MAG: DUF11 domain-containing protein [Chloroflexi bacterium]|nr:DUF11 domain-containing protein [Chloroflexota bacterium]
MVCSNQGRKDAVWGNAVAGVVPLLLLSLLAFFALIPTGSAKGSALSSASSAWSQISPSGWATTQTLTISVAVTDTAGLDVGTAAYRTSTAGSIESSAWVSTGLSVTSVVSTTAILSVSGATFVDSQTINQIQFMILDVSSGTDVSSVYPVWVDATTPTSTISSPVSTQLVSTTFAIISAMAYDATSGVQRVDVSTDDGTSWSAASGTNSWSYNWAIPSSDGMVYGLRSRATDVAGNAETPRPAVTVTVDNRAPLSSITLPASGSVISGSTQLISGTASDGYGVSAVDVSVNGGAWLRATGTSNWTYSWTVPVTDGVSYNIRSRATDVAGNIESPGPGLTVNVDTAPPSSTIASPTNGQAIGGASYVVSGTASDGYGVDIVQVSIGGGPWTNAVGTTTWAYTWTLPANGSYNIRSQGIDRAGNVETASTGITVNVQNPAPTSAITSPSSGTVITGTTRVVAGASSESTSLVEVSLGGGSWVAATGTTAWQYTWNLPSKDGASYSIRSRARDTLGNVETPGSGVNVVVDNRAPSSTITVPSSGSIISGTTQTIGGTAFDGYGVSAVDVSINGGTWQRASGTLTWTYTWSAPAGEGASYNIRSRATDLAGNEESPGAGVTVSVDRVPASSSITSPSNGEVLTGSSHVVTGTAWDATSGIQRVEVSTDDGASWTLTSGTTSWSYNWTIPPSDGVTYRLRSRATDMAGNREAPGAVITVTVDNRSPTSNIASPSGSQIISGTTYLVSGSASDGSGVASVEVSIGGATWTAASGTSSWQYAWNLPPSDGASFSIRSRARDAHGNAEIPGPGINVLVDNTGPTSIITAPTEGIVITGTTQSISGTASDGYGVSAVDVAVNGGPWQRAIGTTSWTYDWTVPITEGMSYSIRSRATDAAGNVESPGAGATVTVDRLSPASSITEPSSGRAISGTVYALRGVASSGAVAVEVSIQDGAWEPAVGMSSWAYMWTLPADGVYAVRSRARDAAGNVEAPAPGVTITVDNTRPIVSIGAPTTGAVLNGGLYVVAGSATDSLSGIAIVQVSTDGGASWLSAQGADLWQYTWSFGSEDRVGHLIRARAVDRAGNVSEVSAVTAYVDNVAPVASIRPLPVSVEAAQFLVEWSGSDASGVASYDVQVKADNGSWTDWLLGTTATSAYFEGNRAHSFSFRARARDTVGNLGAYAANGDTVTSVAPYRVFVPYTVRTPSLAESQKTASATIANGGDELTYSILLRNTGNGSATARLSDPIPSNTSFVPGSAIGLTYDGGSRILSWSGQLAPSTSRIFTFRVQVNDDFAGTVVNEAIVSTSGEPTVTLSASSRAVVANGRFEIGNLSEWPNFGELARSAATGAGRPSGQAALLGSPSYACDNGSPLGAAQMFQTVTLPPSARLTLSFWYRLVSQDVQYSPVFGSLGDTLEVFILGANGNETQSVLQYGAPYRNVSCSTAAFDSGWVQKTFDLTPYAGQTVRLHFSLRTRIDGWYNTYAYVDDVRIDP